MEFVRFNTRNNGLSLSVIFNDSQAQKIIQIVRSKFLALSQRNSIKYKIKIKSLLVIIGYYFQGLQIAKLK